MDDIVDLRMMGMRAMGEVWQTSREMQNEGKNELVLRRDREWDAVDKAIGDETATVIKGD